jgi:tripartite-type tricarboxylate transporter receptor subunit TctC
MFNARAGLELAEIPYKEVGQAVNDLIGGRIDAMFLDTVAAEVHVESKTMRALAVTTEARSSKLPEVPALKEYILDFEFFGFLSLSVPTGTPLWVQERLNQLVNGMIQVESFRSQLQAMGLVMQVRNLAAVDQFIQREQIRWAAYVKQAGIEPQ